MHRTAATIVALALALPASADPDEARRTEARVHFEAARTHHNVGRFEEAIEAYQAAYDLVPLPDLLFNIGQCHRNLKNHERAIFFFERFLQEAPETSDGDLVRKLIAELEGELARKKSEETSTATLAAPALVQEPVAPPPPPPVEEEGVHEKWWFWTIRVVGAAAAAGGAIALTQTGTPEGTLGTIDLR